VVQVSQPWQPLVLYNGLPPQEKKGLGRLQWQPMVSHTWQGFWHDCASRMNQHNQNLQLLMIWGYSSVLAFNILV
jgi:hypothetical protein